MIRSRSWPGALALGLALIPTPQAHAQAPDPRGDLEIVAHALDVAISKVSRPMRWTFVPEGDAALSYRVAGLGAIFVVAPRALPARTAVLPLGQDQGGTVLSRVMRVVEQTLQQAESTETRERLQQTLESLHRQQQELAARAAAQERERAALERLTEERLARRAREAAQGVPVDSRQRVRESAAAEEALRTFEAEAAAFQREAESARQAAERALDQVAREMRVRLGGADPAAPARRLPEDLAGPAGAPRPAFVPPPPWRLWGDLEPPREERPPEQVVGDVREAVTGVLETHAAGLRLLAPQDVVLVTVDFIPQGSLLVRGRPERTLVVRVHKRELEERAAGSLGAEALRSRIEYIEY